MPFKFGVTSNPGMLWVAGITALGTAYIGWFWRQPSAWPFWAAYLIAQCALSGSWWWMLRRGGYSLTMASAFADVIVNLTWYLPLIVWKESTANPGQLCGLSFILVGALLSPYPDSLNAPAPDQTVEG